LSGDIVVIEIFSGAEEIKEKAKFEDQKKIKDQENQARQDKCDLSDSESDHESEDLNGNIFNCNQLVDVIEEEPKRFGKVVYIMERLVNHGYAGILRMEIPGRSSDRVIWFKPNDKAVPLIAIDKELAPKEFLMNPSEFENTIFTASIRKWPPTANSPYGNITGKLGQMGEIPVETDALLEDAGVYWDDFSEDVLNDLPSLVFYLFF
jgi:protein SSD1